MSGIVDGLKWGIIINLGAVVILPVLTRFLGTQPGSGPAAGHRPFGDYVHHPSCDDPGINCTGGYGFYCSDDTGFCGGQGDQMGFQGGGGGMGPGGGGGMGPGGGGGGGGHKKKKHKKGGGGGGGGHHGGGGGGQGPGGGGMGPMGYYW